MADIAKRILSGSTQGKGIEVAATASAGTTIHTAVSGTTDIDEVWLFAVNNYSSDVILTLEWGGTTATDDNIVITLPAYSGLVCVSPGLLLQNSLVVKAFATVANCVSIFGYVNRVSS